MDNTYHFPKFNTSAPMPNTDAKLKEFDSSVCTIDVQYSDICTRHGFCLMSEQFLPDAIGLYPLKKTIKDYVLTENILSDAVIVIRSNAVESDSIQNNEFKNEGVKNFIPIANVSRDTALDTVLVRLNFSSELDGTKYVHKAGSPILGQGLLQDRIMEFMNNTKLTTLCSGLVHPLTFLFPTKTSSVNVTLDFRIIQTIICLKDKYYHVASGFVDPNTTFKFVCGNDQRLRIGSKGRRKIVSEEEFLKSVSSSLAGFDKMALEIYREMLLPRTIGDLQEDFGIKLDFGILFEGPSGTGKSALAQAIAKAVNGHYMIIRGSGLKSKFVTERSIRDLFDVPLKEYIANGNLAPLYFICIDELDAIRNSENNLHDTSVTNQILSLTDVPPNLIIIGTTNRKDQIDPEGRMGTLRRFSFSLPDKNTRSMIIKHYMNKVLAYLNFFITKEVFI